MERLFIVIFLTAFTAWGDPHSYAVKGTKALAEFSRVYYDTIQNPDISEKIQKTDFSLLQNFTLEKNSLGLADIAGFTYLSAGFSMFNAHPSVASKSHFFQFGSILTSEGAMTITSIGRWNPVEGLPSWHGKNLPAYNDLSSHSALRMVEDFAPFVFDVYREQAKIRPIFRDELMIELRNEDMTISKKRVTHFGFKAPEGGVQGTIGIFDGRNFDYLEKEPIPVARKYPDMKVSEYAFELRRGARDLKQDVLIGQDLFFAVGQHFQDLAKVDAKVLAAEIYAHTDVEFGKGYLERRGFKVVVEGVKENEVVLRTTVKEFIQTMVLGVRCQRSVAY